ncbi:acetyl-CoA carboxylase biotin carboxyl carrier protein [Candidatus Synechococcus calcipolaris G9]|uniref:Biotin carboxyl carrier protein of acetyl-CoA carboxylase n=1 Tax=Candidatus Synechococcus calcipolaris G9 TaxID=1497997 RepID=A0ABT6EZ81_9SYNE|nr:acetyl-CoA carboxylase biotin carboxyl carrier protein [Candidatus Synechococcus calcipolaris]MDG2990893.1 acetyl-CoA carboxylase biotin carboxyl carrier protein [Candidatus Synechococcus calcipolaris G9]
MEFDLNQVRELLVMFNQTNVTELNLKSSQFELVLRKDQPSAPPASSLSPTVTVMPSPSPTPEPEPTPPPQSSRKTIDIPSPMVGTFYRAPAPDEPAFVDIGDTVRKGQVVCIIEAMKLMNEIEAEVNGQVVEILVENGEPIEYGQPLLRILPT